MSYSMTWLPNDETNPPNFDPSRNGATLIRNTKVAVRERVNAGHYFETSGGINDAQGVHKYVTETITNSGVSPSILSDVVNLNFASPTTYIVPTYNAANTYPGRRVRYNNICNFQVNLSFTVGNTANGYTLWPLATNGWIDLLNTGSTTWLVLGCYTGQLDLIDNSLVNFNYYVPNAYAPVKISLRLPERVVKFSGQHVMGCESGQYYMIVMENFPMFWPKQTAYCPSCADNGVIMWDLDVNPSGEVYASGLVGGVDLSVYFDKMSYSV